MESGMGIGGKACPFFAGRTDHLDWRLLEAIKQAQYIIPRNAIDPVNTALEQGFNQGVGDVYAERTPKLCYLVPAYGWSLELLILGPSSSRIPPPPISWPLG